MLSYRILADRCVDIWNSFSPPVFSLDQFHQLTTALERCPLLKSCVEAYPPPFYTKILRLTRQKQPYFQPYVHNALFNGLRTRADRWLNSLSSSHFDQDLVDDGTYCEQLLSWLDTATLQVPEEELRDYINFIFNYVKEHPGVTGFEHLIYAMQWCDHAVGEELQTRRFALLNALADAMYAYEEDDHDKYFFPYRYSCMPGLDERILDTIGTLEITITTQDNTPQNRPKEIYASLVHSPFFRRNESGGLSPSPLFTAIYLKARCGFYDIVQQTRSYWRLRPMMSKAASLRIYSINRYENLLKLFEKLLSLPSKTPEWWSIRKTLAPFIVVESETKSFKMHSKEECFMILSEHFDGLLNQIELQQPSEPNPFISEFIELFEQAAIIEERLLCGDDQGTGDLVEKMAHSSGLQRAHVELLLDILPGGLTTLNSWYEAASVKVLSWSEAQAQLNELIQNMLSLTHQIMAESNNAYFPYLCHDHSLYNSMLADFLQQVSLDSLMARTAYPDYLMEQFVQEIKQTNHYAQQLERIYKTALEMNAVKTVRRIRAICEEQAISFYYVQIDHFSPLHYTIQQGFFELAKLFIDSYQQSRRVMHLIRQTPLDFAVLYNQPEIVRFILNHANPDLVHSAPHNPFLQAIQNGHSEIIRLFLRHYPDINLDKLGPAGQAAIHIAVKAKQQKVVLLLIKKGVFLENRNDEKKTALHIALEENDLSMAHLLLNHGANFDACIEQGVSCLHLAVSNRSLEAVELLFSYGADIHKITDSGKSLLSYAMTYFSLPVIQFLIEHGVNPNHCDRFGTMLHRAIEHESVEALQLLINAGADINMPNEDEETPLDFAVSEGLVLLARILLEHAQFHKIDVKIQPASFTLAAQLNHVDVFNLCFDYGLSPNSFYPEHESPLFIAVSNGQIELLLFLLTHPLGFSIDHTDCSMKTVLHHAVLSGCTESFDFLLEFDSIPLNAQDCDGKTSLHLAVQTANEDFILKLLGQSAIIDLPDRQGRTAYDLAQACHDQNIIRHFEQYSAARQTQPVLFSSQEHTEAVHPAQKRRKTKR